MKEPGGEDVSGWSGGVFTFLPPAIFFFLSGFGFSLFFPRLRATR